MPFRLFFLSSSRVKLDHFKYLLKGYDIDLLPPKNYGQAYFEPRIQDRNLLLEESLKDANKRLAKRTLKLNTYEDDSLFDIDIPGVDLFQGDFLREHYANDFQNDFFFIEDTSVRIEALSETCEYPGVDIKYWMQEHNFKDVDLLLKQKGNNRAVIVRSDIVLYIPKLYRDDIEQSYKVFVGESQGYITNEEKIFSTNAVYPWLDNKTFNKWFVPEGETNPISMLPIDQSLAYDFRRKAAAQLLDYLNNKKLIKEKTLNTNINLQPSLFSQQNIIICGPSCTGKTVLANHLSRHYGYYHIEASDYMHQIYIQKHGINNNISIHSFAAQMLSEQPEVVSNEILKVAAQINNTPIVITGFRNPKELSSFVDNTDYLLFYVDSKLDDRYQRNIKRARADKSKSLEDFKNKDKIQFSMGLDKICGIENIIKIKNNSTLKNYLNNFTKNHLGHVVKKNKRHFNYQNITKSPTLEQSIILTLTNEKYKLNRWLTTSQIAKEINSNIDNYRRDKHSNIIHTNKNNVSRYFNQRVYPYYKALNDEGTLKYKISATGESYAFLILANICSSH